MFQDKIMLTLEERFKILALIRHLGVINRYPVRVDLKTWEIRAGTSTNWTSWSCGVTFGLFIAHVSYKCLGLLHAALLVTNTPLHQVLIHAQVTAACVVYGVWYYILYMKHSDLNAHVTKLTLTGGVAAAGGKNVTKRTLCKFCCQNLTG